MNKEVLEAFTKEVAKSQNLRKLSVLFIVFEVAISKNERPACQGQVHYYSSLG